MKVLIVASIFPRHGRRSHKSLQHGKGLTLAGCDVTVVTAFHITPPETYQKYKENY